MAIEDFEWEGDEELPARATQLRLAPAADAASVRQSEGWLDRLRKNVWLEPALRLFGMALLLGVLAGIGVVATTYAKPGGKLPEGSRLLTNALGTSWLKPTPNVNQAASASDSAVTAAPVAAAASSAAPGAAAASSAAPAPEPPAAAEPAPNGGASTGLTPDGKVILNAASADELTKLPGVGPKRAAAIVALRNKLKRFKHPTELLRVKGIGPRGLQRMLPHLVLDAPSAS